MEHTTFNNLFRDLISRIYDRVAIENHPLAAQFLLAPDVKASRADTIHQLVLGEIERLRPDGTEVLWQSPEWRPYLILYKRYIEGEDPSEIARSLYIGDRQFRRDHSRALQALSMRIWINYFSGSSENDESNTSESEDQQQFEFHPDELDLREIIEGVVNLISRRLENEQVKLNIEFSTPSPTLFTDRVVLRQILLSLLNFILHLKGEPEITLQVGSNPQMFINLLFKADENWSNIRGEEQDTLDFVRKLSPRLPAGLEEIYPLTGQAGPVEIRLSFAAAKPKIVLIVDDQPATLKMFQRYLSGTSLEVTGLSDPALAVETAQQLQPAMILLDVMMPRIDGWEVLQALQFDLRTKKIPIIICSAWGEPELARSLGAVEFLKKPVVQKDLLAAFHRLKIIPD